LKFGNALQKNCAADFLKFGGGQSGKVWKTKGFPNKFGLAEFISANREKISAQAEFLPTGEVKKMSETNFFEENV
jgi:hypothetical protein